MIEFKTVRFKNFFSFGELWTELDIQSSSSTLVYGNSGSGKSTVITEAITFALYGKPFRKIKKGSIINTVNGKGCEVEVTFNIGPTDYRVHRGIKPDFFDIYVDGVQLNQNPNARDYQKHLEENVLKCSFKTWCHIVVLGFANHVPFMELSAGDRRAMVDEVLGIEVFQRMLQGCKDNITSLKTEISSIEVAIEANQNTIEAHKRTLKEVQSAEADHKDRLVALCSELSGKIENLSLANDVLREDINAIMEKTGNLEEEKKTLDEVRRLMTKLEVNNNSAVSKLAFYAENEVCPTCSQNISPELKNQQEIELKTKSLTIKASLEKLETKMLKHQDNIKRIQRAMDIVAEKQTAMRMNNQSISHYQTQIEKTQKDIAGLGNVDGGLVKSIAQTIVEHAAKSKEMTEKKVKLQNDLRHMVLCSGLLKEDGIKGRIIAEYVPVLTKLVNDYLEAMNFMMKIEFDENFEETIYARFRDKLVYQQLSQGEQSRINIAILMAWAELASMRNSIKTNLVVFDEVLDAKVSMSDVSAVMEIVSYIAKDKKLFIISHKPDVTAMYCRQTIKVEKVGNFSRMIIGE